jgi:hypothetical protein
MTTKLTPEALEMASRIIDHWEEYYLERDGHALIEDCLEFSGCLDIVNDQAEGSWKYGLYAPYETPLAFEERSNMRDWLLERQMGQLEGQGVEELKPILDRWEKPKKVQLLLSDLAFYNAAGDQAAARKTRVALRKLGHYVSREA